MKLTVVLALQEVLALEPGLDIPEAKTWPSRRRQRTDERYSTTGAENISRPGTGLSVPHRACIAARNGENSSPRQEEVHNQAPVKNT